MVKNKIVAIVMIIIIALINIQNFVLAVNNSLIDETKKASLTIVKYENAYGKGRNPSDNTPLENVEFTIYKLDESNFEKDTNELEEGIKNGTISLNQKVQTTNKDGQAIFSGLDLGRYFVMETKAPKNVTTKMESFVIDLPRSNETGSKWDYDVTVYPKNITIYGDVELTKYDKEGNLPLQGTVWQLQRKENGVWKMYENTELTTNQDGKINIKGLPVGEYRLIEVQTLDGYILDSSNVQEFTVSMENTSFKFTAINEKPEIEKQVKGVDGNYYEHVGKFKKDITDWKITADIPTVIEKMKDYYITDTLAEGTEYVENSVKIDNLSINTDYMVQYSGQNLKIILVTSSEKVQAIDKLNITYQTRFKDNVKFSEALQNSATLTYTDKINVDSRSTESTYTTEANTAEVHSGKVLIKKVDEKGSSLQGAKFKIATTKENAKDGVYLKDENMRDLEAISDEQGNVVFEGLKYGNDGEDETLAKTTYWIVETETPIYQDSQGIDKHYNLLDKPVQVEVSSSSDTENTKTVKIVNKKGFVLPYTGGSGIIAFVFVGISLIILAIKLSRKGSNKE